MLLPFSTGHFQHKSWPSNQPNPLQPNSVFVRNSQIGSTTLQAGNGLSFPSLAPIHSVFEFQHQPLQRPPFLPRGVTVRPFLDSPSQTVTPPKKKLKIFRPWDDSADGTEKEIRSSAGKLEISPNTNLNKSETSTARVSTLDEDAVDQSKTAFEIFATNLGKSPEGHRCIYCGKIYSRKYGLKIHLRTHTGFKPLKCKVCQRPFGDPSNLNKHVRLHADTIGQFEKTPIDHQKIDSESATSSHARNGHPFQFSLFRCPFCDRTLIRKRDLERHLASRHPNEHFVDVEGV